MSTYMRKEAQKVDCFLGSMIWFSESTFHNFWSHPEIEALLNFAILSTCDFFISVLEFGELKYLFMEFSCVTTISRSQLLIYYRSA